MKKSALFSETGKFSFFKKGFTLIELVVVISIIAILSTIALFGFSKAQASGRDASRSQTMNSFRSALERFYSDNQYYPKAGTTPAGGDFGAMAGVLNSNGYITTASIVDPLKGGCTTQSSIPASGNWGPCGATKAPMYVYDSSTTVPTVTNGVYTNCGYTTSGTPPVTTLTTSGCTAGCATAGGCYALFLFNESNSSVTVFKSPQ